MRPKEALTFLLMGKTGNGKSRTGNTILNRRAFKTSAKVTAETKEVDINFAHFDEFILCVVDGPGLADTSMNEAEDKIAAARNMDKALAMCYGGVHAFLLVIKFSNRFTGEELKALQSLKSIFGDRFMSHVIVVMTGGDMFQQANEDSEQGISFHDWCLAQTGPFRQLYQDCQGRFVLLNNLEKDVEKMREQRLQLVQFAHDLQIRSGRYTSQCFKTAEYERERMILECRAPQLKLEIQEKISLITAEIKRFDENPSKIDEFMIRISIDGLKREIWMYDKGYGVLEDLMKLLAKVEENLNDVEELHVLAEELEEIRKSKIIWTTIGSVCTVAAVGVAVVVPPVGAIAGVYAAATIGNHLAFRHAEKKKKERMKELEIKYKYQHADAEEN